MLALLLRQGTADAVFTLQTILRLDAEEGAPKTEESKNGSSAIAEDPFAAAFEKQIRGSRLFAKGITSWIPG